MPRAWKGKAGELEVAKLVEAWWRQLEPEAKFVRTPRSGGWARSPGFKARGDLMVDPESCRRFPFSVEVKWRKAWSFRHFVEGRSSPVWGWWAQCRRAADEDGLQPLMFFRGDRPPGRKRMPWLVMIPETLYCPHTMPVPIVSLLGTWDHDRSRFTGGTVFTEQAFFRIPPKRFA